MYYVAGYRWFIQLVRSAQDAKNLLTSRVDPQPLLHSSYHTTTLTIVRVDANEWFAFDKYTYSYVDIYEYQPT